MEMPLFVKLEKYDEITRTLRMIRAKVDEARASLEKIKEIKTQEDKEMESWSQELETIQEKINKIEDSLQTTQGQ
ncbi:MAG: hypothetical protein EPN86_01475 [Nanoarchaeota archaeon]|nr:MAG: hypothetical protein EPN86_01475 [Nanoarchaeota archaeon]